MSNVSDLILFVRDLTGVYSSDIVPDGLIQRFIQQAYYEVCNMNSWQFMERIDYLDLAAGAHVLATGPGVVKVQELVVAFGDDEVSGQQVISTLGLPVEPERFSCHLDVRYDVQQDSIDVYPSFTEDTVVRVRYQARAQVLQLTDEPVFPGEYHDMLAYRAAVKVLTAQADDSNRTQIYAQEFQNYVDRMSDEFLLSHEEGLIYMSQTKGVR